MPDLNEKYHENLLHWIWDTLHFELRELQTSDGKLISILKKGTLNPTDGPDFKNACLRIGGLRWHGDIEFHWSLDDWEKHGHHKDPAYNRVILHVVYHDPGGKEVFREDDSSPFVLHLRPHLPENLDTLLSSFQQTEQLPCAGQLHYISQEAIEQQFEQAHREYFESKVDELLTFYNPSLSPSTAWRQVLSLGLFDGLGISLNREPMLSVGRQLHEKILSNSEGIPSLEILQSHALGLGGFKPGAEHNLQWNHKGCRPTNHPKRRLLQAAALMWKIQHVPLQEWYSAHVEKQWKNLLTAVNTETGIGRERGDILYGIVFLPALWLLGNLFHITQLKQSAFKQWMTHHAQLPASLFKLFEQSNLPQKVYKQRLGAIYQLKHYCKPRRCNQCNVLKEIISS